MKTNPRDEKELLRLTNVIETYHKECALGLRQFSYLNMANFLMDAEYTRLSLVESNIKWLEKKAETLYEGIVFSQGWNAAIDACQKAVESNGEKEEMYPCDKCGKLRTKSEGGTTFSICDDCWEDQYGKPAKAAVPSVEEIASLLANQRACRNGGLPIKNVLDVLNKRQKDEVMGDATAIHKLVAKGKGE
jgi:hypothetical protein